MPTRLASLLVLSLLLVGPGEGSTRSPQEWSRNLVSNSGFEDDKERPEDWITVFPPAIANSKPRFSLTEVDPREGKRVAKVRADYTGGFTSFTQEIKVSRSARSLRLEGWARLDQVTFEGYASLVLDFHVPGAEDGGVVVETERLTGRADWTRLVVDAAIPPGTKKILLRCGVAGPSVASFDDIVLRSSKEVSVNAGIYQVTSDFEVRLPTNAEGPVAEPFLRVGALPLSPGQTTLGVRVNTTPAGMVRGLVFTDVGSNRELEIALQTMEPGTRVKVRVDRLVMAVNGGPVDESRLIRLPRTAKLPEAVAAFLGATPGIDPLNEGIEELAQDLEGTDFPGVIRSVLESQHPTAGEDAQADTPAPDSLELARTAAALLRARRIPARLVAGSMPRVPGGVDDDGGPAEHFFCEAYTETLEWTRLNPATGVWPVQAMDAVIHRYVDARSGLTAEGQLMPSETASPALILERRLGRYGRWHQCRNSSSVHLMEPGYLQVKNDLDGAFRDATGVFLDADRWDPMSSTSEPVDGVGALHIELERWRNSSQLVGY